MTHEEIQALSLSNQSTLGAVLGQMNVVILTSSPEAEDWYDRFTANPKPTRQEVESAFETYKLGLTAEENNRQAEEDRVTDIRTRWAAIEDPGAAVAEAGLLIPNPAIELERIINQNDQDRLEAIEAAWATFVVKRDKLLARNSRRARGKKARECCFCALDVIAGWNEERNLTTPQIVQMATDFQQADFFLSKNMPRSAKTAIEAIAVGPLVPQEMKDEILEIFTEFGY